MTKFQRVNMMLAVVAAIGLAAGCGDDDGSGDDDDDDMMDAGTDGGGPMGPESAMCGGETCEGIEVLNNPLDGCCPNGEDDATCGLSTDNAVFAAVGINPVCAADEVAPGDADETCPSANIAGMVPLPGCCLPASECGFTVDLTNIGGPNFGCQSWGLFTNMFLTDSGIEDPSTPQACGE